MNLSKLIDTHRGGRSYAELSRDCGGSPTDKRLQQLVRQPIKAFPDPETVAAIAKGLRVPQAVVVLAAAESLGLDVANRTPRLVELLPATAADLSEEQAAAIAHVVRLMSGTVITTNYDKLLEEAVDKAASDRARAMLGDLLLDSRDPAEVKSTSIDMRQVDLLTEADFVEIIELAEAVEAATDEGIRRIRAARNLLVHAAPEVRHRELVAARTGTSVGRRLRQHLDAVGEESQDPGE